MSVILQQAALPLLCVALLTATLVDLRSARIPNALTAPLAAMGLAMQAAVGGWAGLGHGLLGLLAGLVCLLPFYVLRGMAAGDVKLMAAAGAWLGAPLTVIAVLGTLLAGALLGLAVLALNLLRSHGVRGALLAVGGGFVGLPRGGVRFPYAGAIALGVGVALFLAYRGELPGWLPASSTGVFR
jgi:prepilin peptidase CpaA